MKQVQCICGNNEWRLYRPQGYEFSNTPAEGADGLIRCLQCGNTARTDGKLADHEGRLTG